MKSSGPNGRQGAAGARRLAGLTAGRPGSRKDAGGQGATDRTRGTELGARRPQVGPLPGVGEPREESTNNISLPSQKEKLRELITEHLAGPIGSAHLLRTNRNLNHSFRMDWLDLLAVQGTLKSLLQHHSSKASIFQYV